MRARLLIGFLLGTLLLFALAIVLLVDREGKGPVATPPLSGTGEAALAQGEGSGEKDGAARDRESPVPLRHRREAGAPPAPERGGASPFLTGPAPGDALDLVLDYLRTPAHTPGYTGAEFADPKLTDRYASRHNGVTHLYLRQRHEGIEVYNGNLNANVLPDGSIINLHNDFIPDIASEINRIDPVISARRAVEKAAAHYRLTPEGSIEPLPVENPDVAAREELFSPAGISLAPIPVRLNYVALEGGETRLAWNMVIQFRDTVRWFDLNVDAETGVVISEVNWVNGAAYNVYPFPLEAPNDGARSVQVDVHDPSASPFGWHDVNGLTGAEFTDTRGNNVNAQEDADANNTGGVRPSGGAGLNFNFPVNLSQNPSSYQSAVTTNLFYWNNVIHDILWHYGFDEPAGNFQENNYGNGGLGGDPVEADSQDGSGTNNANFGTPPDGSNPRMQMYIWTGPNPDRDSSFDNGIIIHEYGHGVSNRLTGGPANASALAASQSRGMGEGWSDFLALALTHQSGDTATTGRGIGTYVLGQSPTGPGIRPYRYTTNLGANPQTFGDLAEGELSVPHGIGSVWCTTLWEVYWALVGAHGYDSDLIGGNGGNNLAIQLVLDGMKLQPVTPTYTEARDAILLADQVNNGGANFDLLWGAFAKRGLGASAYDGGSPSSLSVVETFDLPDDLEITPLNDNIFRPGGRPGGPFTPSGRSYSLRNTGTGTVNWTASSSVNWLTLSRVSGSLSPGGTTSLVVTLNGIASALPGGVHSGRIDFVNTNSGQTIPRFVELSVNDLGEAVDSPSLSFTSSPPSWFTQSQVTHDGVDAAQAGAITHNQDSAMELTVTGPDELRFFWKVDSEGGWDFLRFYDNGVVRSSISGDVDWTEVSYSIPSGTRTLRWVYSKDGSVNDGADTGWVDQLNLASTDPLPTIVSELTANGTVDSPFQYQIVATNSPTSYSSGTLPQGLVLNASTGLISGTPVSEGIYSVSISASNGAGSDTRTLTIRVSGTASYPFLETFESGALGTAWTMSGTGPNRIQVTQNHAPLDSWHVTMDSAQNQNYARNELTLAIDLAGQSDVALEFDAKDFSDEENGPPTAPFVGGANFDGVAVSADGTNWYEVQPLRDEITSNYTRFSVDLDAAIASWGLSYTSSFFIRFNQYDNYGIDIDGIAFDNISVAPASPEISVEQPTGTELVSGASTVSFGSAGTGHQRIRNFTIRNLGTQPLTGLSASLVGAAASDYNLSAFGSTTLTAGQATTLGVSMIPSALGTREATLRIASNDGDENPFEIDLTGEGIIPPVVAAMFPFEETFETGTLGEYWTVSGTGSHRTLPSQAVGPFEGSWHLLMDSSESGTESRNELTLVIDLQDQPSAVLTFWAKEFGEDAHGPPSSPFTGGADFDGVAISEDGTTWYEVQPLRGEISEDYSEFTVDLAAAAAARGLDFTSAFRIRFNHFDDLPINQEGFAFDNIRIAPFQPEITVEYPAGTVLTAGVSNVDFGVAETEGGQASRTFVIRNEGSQALTGLAATFSGANTEFGAPPMSATTLAPGESTTLTVFFVPEDQGTRTATLHIASNDGDESPFDIGLRGEAIPVVTAPFPFYEDFEDGSWAPFWKVSGTGAYRTRVTESYGPHGGSRHLTMDASSSVFSRNEFTLGIDLSGQDGVILRFWAKDFNDEPDGPPPVPFVGGANFDGVAVSTDGINWYEVQPLRNQVSGTYSEFSVDLDAAIAAHGLSHSSSFRIRFNHYGGSPISSDGFAIDDISVIREAPEIEVEQPAGTGLTDNVDVIDFGEVAIGGQSQLVFTVRNTGLSTLTGLAASFSGDAAAEFGAGSFGSTALAPGGATTFTVDFSPSSTGQRFANLHITSNDADENPFDVVLNGRGGNSEIGVEQPAGNDLTDGVSTVDFGSGNPGQSLSRTFTIRNHGTSDLLSLAASVAGGNAEEFSLGALSSTTIAPGETATFDVSFSPGGGGTRSAILRIASNDVDENPFDVNLSGVGFDPEIAVEQPAGTGLDSGSSQRSFGSVLSGETGEMTFTVRNTGTLDLTGLAVSFAGLNPGDFSATSPGQTSLVPGGSTTFTVTFMPQQFGDRSATLRIASNDRDEDPFEVLLSGIGVIPEIAVDLVIEPDGIPKLYGSDQGALYEIDPATAETTLIGDTVTNFVTGLAYDAVNDRLFGIESDTDTLVTINRETAAATTIGPLGYGAASAGLAYDPGGNVLYSSRSTNLYRIDPETGAGTLIGNEVPGGTSSYTFDPNGGILYGLDTSEPETLFRIDTTDGQVTEIGPTGESTALEGMAYDPVNDTIYLCASGRKLFTLDSNTGAATLIGTFPGLVYMQGLAFVSNQGVSEELTDGADSLDFGEVVLGAQHSMVIRVRNLGTSALDGLAATFSGVAAGDYSAGEFGATSLPPGESTTVTVNFSPTAIDQRSASLQIASNDNDENPFDISLTGIGADPEIAIEQPAGTGLTDGSSTVDFGSSELGQQVQRTFTIRNEGVSDLTGLQVSVGGDNAGDYAAANPSQNSIAPGQSLTFDVTFSPSGGGDRLAMLQVASNDLDENPFDIALTGVGLSPEIVVEEPAATELTSGVSLRSFGTLELGQTGDMTFTIRNAGDLDLSGLAVSFEGANPGDFSSSPPGQTTLDPGESTTITVTFTPQGAGLRSGTLVIANNDADENPFLVNLNGEVVAPEIAVDLIQDYAGGFEPVLYGSNSSGLYTIDPATGRATLVGPTPVQISGLAYDAANDVLYGIDAVNDNLVTLDRNTGALTTVGPLGYDSASTGLAYDPANHVLYAARSSLYRINPDTGRGTFIGSGLPPNVTGFAYDPNAGILYGVSSSQDPERLYRISTENGTGTLVGPTGITSALEGMAYDPINDILYLNDLQANRLYTLDVNTGAATAVGSNVVTNIQGLAFVYDGSGALELFDGDDTVDFGTVAVGGASFETLQIRNEGTLALTGLSASFTGANSGDFSAGAFGSTSLNPGESTTVEISFTPSDGNNRVASLQIASNDFDENPFDIALTGAGLASEIAVEQPVGVDLTDGAATVDFTQVSLGAQGGRTFTIRNAGVEALTGLAASFSGASAAEYSAGAIGATTLDPGESTTFTVNFAPAATGVRPATLHIANNDTDENPFDVDLTGEGVDPEIAVEQPAGTDLGDGNATIDFGSLLPGEEAVRVFTIRNTGVSTLNGLGATIVGPQASDFSAGALSSTSLSPGESATVSVTATGRPVGPLGATLQMASNDADENPFDIELAAEGIAFSSLDAFADSFALVGDARLPLSDTDGDGVTLEEEYNYGLDPTIPDAAVMEAGGDSGLPLIRMNGGRLEIEFVRRRDDPAVSAVAHFSDRLPDGFSPATEPESVTMIDVHFDRVIVRDSAGVTDENRRFGKVRVTHTPPDP